jgi:hypothetical protein
MPGVFASPPAHGAERRLPRRKFTRNSSASRASVLASSINASGEIVGLGVTSDGNLHGFMAVPDNAGNFLPLERTASPTPISEDARKTVFRRRGIRGR